VTFTVAELLAIKHPSLTLVAGGHGEVVAAAALRRPVEDRLSRQPGPYVRSLHGGAIVALLEAADLTAARITAGAVALGARSRGRESAARALGAHRHTLRYRIRRIAPLTGRNLGLAAGRVESWLALKAAEVLVGRRAAER
jgi:acyl-coenzyme A thioesterase PaaI-like protein